MNDLGQLLCPVAILFVSRGHQQGQQIARRVHRSVIKVKYGATKPPLLITDITRISFSFYTSSLSRLGEVFIRGDSLQIKWKSL